MATANEELKFRMRQVSTTMLKLGHTLLQTRLIVAHGFMSRKKYAEAIEETEVVLDEFMSEYGSDHPLIMSIWTELAQMHTAAGNIEEAAQCLAAASAIMKTFSQKKRLSLVPR